ncbi:hypothetical protein HZS55_20895 [Halosimplex rubrum]|uniref:Uncharacterized protein n=1 Tax=Halosimplex rubrum TaxID=869889 RepID=A0A7D5P815_9EURY|nr:hypothetical protein [Halosimplex rubrum]QLH79598.1 hypothetical protein HZS55_20895 [Halosimplex rubrum]
MTPTRRSLLRTVGTGSLAGLTGCGAIGGRTATPDCDVACFESDRERADDGPDSLTLTHVAGRDLSAGEVAVSGVAFDWPPARESGFTYSWAELADVGPKDGIAGRSLVVEPALVDAVRISWIRDGEPVELGAFRVADCERGVACFEAIHRGADDALDRLTVRHVDGQDLPAEEVFLTGVAEEYPPDPETGRTVAWHELSDLAPGDGIAGATVQAKLGLVERVSVLWRRGGEESAVESFQLY